MNNTLKLFFCGLIFANTAFAESGPIANPVPGGIVMVSLGDSTTAKPQVFYNDRKVMVVERNKQWQAIIGLPLEATPGLHLLNVSRDQADQQVIPFEVQDKSYQTQYITLADQRKVDPSEEDLARIEKESGEIMSALRAWSDVEKVDLSFQLPADGPLNKNFGLRRFFNQQPRKPHSGLDISASRGTPIKSPAAGKVVQTGEYFFNGNSVFIDHGQGLITMYCHLERIDVKPGQILDKGTVIGAVGSTGRATGPHLHWAVSLNDARVDPLLFFPQFNPLAEGQGKKLSMGGD